MKRYLNLFVLLLGVLLITACQSSSSLDVKLEGDTFEVGTLKSACDAVKSINGNPVDSVDGDNNSFVAGEYYVTCSATDLKAVGETLLVFESNKMRSELIVHLVDTIAPIIHLDKKEIVVDVNNEYFNIKDLVKVTDNYDENLSLAINGSFDIHKPGNYNVTLIAKDSSGNETKKDVVISVKEKEKEIVTVIEERPIYIDGGSSGSSAGESAPDNQPSSSGGTTSNDRGERPSNRNYLFSDGYTTQTAPSACSRDLDIAFNKGWGGACRKYYGENNESEYPIGMSLVIYD